MLAEKENKMENGSTGYELEVQKSERGRGIISTHDQNQINDRLKT